jgi:hypothetical protein
MHKIYDGYRPRISTTATAACPAVFLTEGVTLFTTEIHPTDDGYDFGELKDMLAWRDRQR